MRTVEMEETMPEKKAEIPRFTDEELRARNAGINHQMPSNLDDMYGTRWKEGPGHPEESSQRK